MTRLCLWLGQKLGSLSIMLLRRGGVEESTGLAGLYSLTDAQAGLLAEALTSRAAASEGSDEYGTKGLQEIMEDLVCHCRMEAHEDATCQLILPRSVLERFGVKLHAKEGFVGMDGVPVEAMTGQLISGWYSAGLVRLFPSDGFEAKPR